MLCDEAALERRRRCAGEKRSVRRELRVLRKERKAAMSAGGSAGYEKNMCRDEP